MNSLQEKNLYGNCTMLAPDGTEMCRCDMKRAKWYLDRKIATVVSTDPLVFMLSFTPSGKGSAGDAFALAEKENRCVVCGEYHSLTKHHIVPYMYRQWMPDKIKNRNSHDIVIICEQCHVDYEAIAWDLKNKLNQEATGDLIRQVDAVEYNKKKRLSGLCWCVISKNEKIPESRIVEIQSEIKLLLGYHPTQEELFEFAKMKHTPPTQEGIGKPVVDKLLTPDDFNEFIKLWRNHFLEVTKPRFMPIAWDVDRVSL